ncbi:RepB family plasmid replication initiator protein [Enterobacteriaceae bacterium RIT711]|nr:RepB family plasmid replication initiator protein [Enterobacteriaceae bacterium RIT711]
MGKQLVIKKVEQSTMIYQHNALIGSIQRLTLPGKRALLMALGLVGNKDVKPDGTVRDEFGVITTVTVADYASIFNMDLRNASTDIYAGVTDLTTATVTVRSIVDGVPNEDIYPWLHHTNIEDAKSERGKYTFTLNPDVLQFVGLLESNFTAYDLLNVGELKSTNQVRLYELFAQHKTHGMKAGVNFGTWITDADFFKGKVFNLGTSVKKFPTEIKRRFLDGALDAINDTTDLFVEFEVKGKQWIFKIYSGDIAEKKREKWRKERAEAVLKAKEEKRLARLRKQIAAHQAEEATK